LSFSTFLGHILALKMVKKLTGHDIAISQKMKAPNKVRQKLEKV